jgi:hypothetical protein
LFVFFSLLGLTVLAQTSPTNMLPALAPAYGEMKPVILGKYEVPEFWAQHEGLLIFTGFMVVVSAGLLTWLMFRPGPPVVVQPEAVARLALARMIGRPEDGQVLSEISQALRRYIVESFKLPPGEVTTGEFSNAITGNEKIGPELAASVLAFLRECDQRKFSPAGPNTQLNVASRALGLVSEAENRLRAYNAQIQRKRV